jgi:hypothetical protein
VAIAAVVASLTLARHRHEERQSEPQPEPGRVPTTPVPNLDDIRAAGL